MPGISRNLMAIGFLFMAKSRSIVTAVGSTGCPRSAAGWLFNGGSGGRAARIDHPRQGLDSGAWGRRFADVCAAHSLRLSPFEAEGGSGNVPPQDAYSRSGEVPFRHPVLPASRTAIREGHRAQPPTAPESATGAVQQVVSEGLASKVGPGVHHRTPPRTWPQGGNSRSLRRVAEKRTQCDRPPHA